LARELGRAMNTNRIKRGFHRLGIGAAVLVAIAS
jgi:hypothetical protein